MEGEKFNLLTVALVFLCYSLSGILVGSGLVVYAAGSVENASNTEISEFWSDTSSSTTTTTSTAVGDDTSSSTTTTTTAAGDDTSSSTTTTTSTAVGDDTSSSPTTTAVGDDTSSSTTTTNPAPIGDDLSIQTNQNITSFGSSDILSATNDGQIASVGASVIDDTQGSRGSSIANESLPWSKSEPSNNLVDSNLSDFASESHVPLTSAVTTNESLSNPSNSGTNESISNPSHFVTNESSSSLLVRISQPRNDSTLVTNGYSEKTLGVDVLATSGPNAVSQPISTGSQQEISFGDITNTENTTALISLDKSNYALGDTVTVTVKDSRANFNSEMMNTLQLNISSKADPAGILVTLTETTPDSGIFEGTFGITDKDSTGNSLKVNPLTGDKIEISYDASHPRGKVEVSGLTQSGTAQIEEISLPKSNNPSVLTSNAMNVTVSGGAQLPDFRCSEIRDIPELSGEPCYSINITMSYANLPLTFEKTPEFCASCGETQPPGTTLVTATPSELTIYLKEGNSWSDVGSVTIDENAKTVTAPDVFFSPSRLYIIGVSGANAFHCPSSSGTFGTTAAGGGCGGGAGGSGGGGGGGGLALPGDGVVLDFIVPVAGAPQLPPSSPSSEPSTGPSAEREGDRETGGIGSTDTTTDTSDSSNRSEKAAVTELETLHPLSDSLPGSLAQGSVGENSGVKSGNVTIVVPGEGTITLAYQRLLSDENLTVTPIKNMSEISSLKVTKKSSDGQGTMVTSNNTMYTTVGTIFTIGPSDTRFNDSIIVTIPYDKSQAADMKGEEIRILQDTGTFWEDITTLPAADGSSVTGSISMLGPVVAAIRENNS